MPRHYFTRSTIVSCPAGSRQFTPGAHAGSAFSSPLQVWGRTLPRGARRRGRRRARFRRPRGARARGRRVAGKPALPRRRRLCYKPPHGFQARRQISNERGAEERHCQHGMALFPPAPSNRVRLFRERLAHALSRPAQFGVLSYAFAFVTSSRRSRSSGSRASSSTRSFSSLPEGRDTRHGLLSGWPPESCA